MKPFSKNVIDHVTTGRAVLAQEIDGLSALMQALGSEFNAAVELIAGHCHGPSARGRLMISGMGKSGHIGCKIAATMASTGTPAHFVHPAEASHGDLGMISREDCVLLLSNSGETQELSDIIGYCKRFSIPLIGMVRRRGSMLTEASTIALVLPEVPEASPVSAPTTSTTMMLALGDALAVALLERRGFTREDFAQFHPGGKLGKAFIRVGDLMHADALPLVKENTSVADALLVMTNGRFGCAGVVSANGVLLGIITDGDLRRHMKPELLTLQASEVMTRAPKTIQANALAAEALGLMNDKSITSLFVVDAETIPVGILHIHDCLRAGVA
jgi:arabinose-5-phosphate isomerase